MKLLVTWMLVALISDSHGHFIFLPVQGNGHYLTPYPLIVQHPIIPDFATHPVADAASRETLEEQSDEGFRQHVPDISEEQASLNPDETQISQKPEIPSLPPLSSAPRPSQSPIPQPRPTISRGDTPNVVFNGPQSDGSYDFSYDLGDQKRNEKSDADGNVQGTYSYTGADGKEVTITYIAGANKGYIPEGEGLLPPPSIQPGEEVDCQVPDDDTQQHVPAVVPTKRPPVKTPAPDPEDNKGVSHGGMPYSYNYDAKLSNKTESSDDKGNVEGSYTYFDGAGVKRTVTYTVRGDEGFIAKGDIYPDPGTAEASPLPSRETIQPTTKPPVLAGRDNSIGDASVKGGHLLPPSLSVPLPSQDTDTSRKGTKGVASGWDKYPLGK